LEIDVGQNWGLAGQLSKGGPVEISVLDIDEDVVIGRRTWRVIDEGEI
jgi:hypothetical protein